MKVKTKVRAGLPKLAANHNATVKRARQRDMSAAGRR